MKDLLKKIFPFKEVSITFMVFALMWAFTFIPFNCAFVDPISNALGDFDVYDIVYSKLLEEQPADTNIVLVNIGLLSREEIAAQIKNLNKFSPKVIGLDILFEHSKDDFSDAVLADAFAGCNNVVLINGLVNFNEETGKYDSLRHSISLFNQYAKNGFANLPSDDNSSFRTIREFRPFALYKDSVVNCFTGAIVEVFNKDKFNVLKARGKSLEKINYRGNIQKFYSIDTYQLLDSTADFSFVKDKIVLMGFMGPDFNTSSLEDIFFTPLNERYAGKSFPDMYGIVIHANIISMILNENYVNEMPSILSLLLAIIIGFINVKMLLFIKHRFSKWNGALTKMILFSYSVLNLLLSVLILQHYNYKISLTMAMAAIFLSTTTIETYENYAAMINLRKLKNKKIFSAKE